MTLFQVRHPQPDVVPGTCYGRLDVGLVPGALAASLDALDALDALPRGLPCVTSPARRCRELADALLARGDLANVRDDPRLLEMNFGDWEGRHWDEIGADAVDRWARDRIDHVIPGGESARQVLARVAAFVEDTARSGERDLVVIAHAGVIRSLLHLKSGQPIEHWRFDAPPLAYGSITRLDF